MAMTVVNGELIVGGEFNSVGGSPANNIARWNGSQWMPLGGGTDSAVTALTVYGDQLVAAGDFITADGITVNHIARWDGSSWSPLGGGITEGNSFPPPVGPEIRVRCLRVENGELLVGGNFLGVGGYDAYTVWVDGIAAWNGSSWHALWDIDPSQTIFLNDTYSIASFDEVLRIGVNGGWEDSPGQPVSQIRPFIAGAPWPWDWSGPDTNGHIAAMTEYNGSLVAGGEFTRASNLDNPTSWFSIDHIMQYNGQNVLVLGTGLDGPVYALLVNNTRLFAGGGFAHAGATQANRVAMWDGNAWSAVGGGLDGTVSALAIYNDHLIAAGSFESSNGVPAAHVAAWPLATVMPAMPTDCRASPDAIWLGDSAMLSANPGEGGDAVEWFTEGCGGSLVPGGASMPVTPLSTTTYYARTKNSTTGCVSGACSQATVTVIQHIEIETVPIGNPGNPPDTRYASPYRSPGLGSVEYTYDIGKYEVTAGQYTAFLNAVAGVDTYGLYTDGMWSGEYRCGIERFAGDGTPANPYRYRIASEWANRPVNSVSWGDAARFANWLYNHQPAGMQDSSTTEDGSYYLNGATSDPALIAVTRRTNATWVIPAENEWYKAAYHKNDGVTGNYWDYPTRTNSMPSNRLIEPDPGNNATFYISDDTIGPPYWRTTSGTHENSPNAYGAFDQAGNVAEFNEHVFRIIQGSPYRGCCGGSFHSATSVDELHASYSGMISPTSHAAWVGFRLSRVPPEPAAPKDCSARSAMICNGGFSVLSATPGQGADTVEWFTGSCGGGTPVPGGASPAVHPTVPTGYYARSRNSVTGRVSSVCCEVTVNVDEVDADGDRVCDASDQCPATPSGQAVDEVGCDLVRIRLVGELSSMNRTFDVTVKDKYAFVADGTAGLQVVDITYPWLPRRVASWHNGQDMNVDSVSIVGALAYVADFNLGLHILDVSDPVHPQWLGTCAEAAGANKVAVVGNYAYVAAYKDNGLVIVDIKNSASPHRVSAYPIPGSYTEEVVVNGCYAYVASYLDKQLRTLNICDPANPVLASIKPTDGYFVGLELAGDKLYAAVTKQYSTCFSGLEILDLTDPASPQLLGASPSQGDAYEVVVSGHYAFEADTSAGLRVIDVSNPANPVRVGGHDTDGHAFSLAVSGDYVFVADDYSLAILRVRGLCEGAAVDGDGDGIADCRDICLGQPNQDQADADGDWVGDLCDACPNTITAVVAESTGCPPVIPFDLDRDGDVHDNDLNVFVACMTGPAVPYDVGNLPADCAVTANGFLISPDYDGDGDVDQVDFGAFQRCLSGAEVAADPRCGRSN